MGNKICVDAGSEYCPCHLAKSGDCISCSLLSGKDLCECNLKGICIYQNFKKNNEKISDAREGILCKVLKKKEIETNVYLISISIPKYLAHELIHPGSYILLKDKKRKDDMFNSPISVMNIDFKNYILDIVIESLGPKTKDLLNSDTVFIKGPYTNGIFGIKYFKKLKSKKVLILAKGLSSVTLVNAVNNLLKNNNEVRVFFDNSGKKIQEVEKILKESNIDIKHFDFKNNENIIRKELKKGVDMVFSAGSNHFNKNTMNIVDSIDTTISLAITNNNLICCGEGICGACIVKIKGEKMKTCKTQIEPRLYLKEALK
ncbi:MAG: sulfide/dihydroorotate dehydrogenase-like FAD/NAD-binding protein [Tepidibacter sp.]|uniref:sulfide/dihydroorotate dehydrogenase-like FAD/NAD-binding protein n=1 Tax=Tepidibacter sp. TaxID=2529387 RepID=UPI0025E765EC|nr:sulfide/dihydroorotate dehydrogenase-like FAD/NAD-binding protein [Tepidibacter sp.]MCT4509735.1 sulfide/dihydroorotate dehydrogenase-like FAD/NAD-binding protein [Tepidibacter sp.]